MQHDEESARFRRRARWASEKEKAFSEGGGASHKPAGLLSSASSGKAYSTSQKAGGLTSLLRRPAPSHFPLGLAAE
eukprot:9128138-Pyramimonas_sp.AAC.1